MATFSVLTATGSTDGRGRLVVQTASPGDTIHTCSSTTTTFHEVWIYAYNSHSAVVDLSVEFGGTTAPDDVIKQTLPAATVGNYVGLIPVVEGLRLKGNAVALIVKAYASVASKVTLFVNINEIAA